MSQSPWKKPIEARVALFKRYYARENERPLFGFFYGSEYPLHRYPASRFLPEDRPLVPADFPVEPYLDDCDSLFQMHEQCGGDFIWSGSCFWGIPWLEVALGCDIIASHDTGSISTRPPRDFTGPDSLPAFDAGSPWMRKTVEFLDKMAERSSGRWPLATTRMRGIADLLSALYGGDGFIFAILEKPEEVRAVAEKLTDFFIAYGRLQLGHIPDFHGGIGSFYYNAWAPRGTVWHQEDAAALLSPDMYREFIEPCDRRIVEAFAGCIMHLHPSGFVPVDACVSMGFTAIELHIDKGGPSAQDLYDAHRKIQAEKPLLIWGDIPEPDFEWIFRKLPPEGLAVLAVVDSPEQAKMLWDRYMRS